MKGKSKLPTKQLHVTDKSGAKVVKTYRIDPLKWEEAENKCQAQHGCGVASIVEDLIISYFGLKKSTHG